MQFPSIDSLSLREKIGQTCQMHGKDLAGISKDQLGRFFQQNPVGSLFLGGEVIASEDNRAEALQQLIADCQSTSQVPLSIAGDLENGAGGAICGLTSFPHYPPQTLAR